MRRSSGLQLTRRHFCGLAAAGIAVAGCTDGSLGPIQTGGLGGGGGGDDQGQPDAPVGKPVDGSVQQPDASAATCTGGETDVGAPSTFVAGTPKYFSTGSFFVVRDANGLYALTAKCTHEGATCTVKSNEFYCPRHGAEFTFNGDIISGPVSKGLKHYGMCTLANGHVAVNTSMTVSETTRLDA